MKKQDEEMIFVLLFLCRRAAADWHDDGYDEKRAAPDFVLGLLFLIFMEYMVLLCC